MDKIASVLDLAPMDDFVFVFEYDREAWAKIPGAFPGWQTGEKRKNDPNYKLLQSQRAKAAWAKRKEGLVYGD